MRRGGIQPMKWSDIVSGAWIVDAPVPEIGETPSARNPALFKSAKQMFVKAGVHILRADTTEGVKLCKDISSSAGQVWGVVRPSAKLLSLEEISSEDLLTEVKQRVKLLVEAGPDVILLESFTDVTEAVLAIEAAKKATKLKIAVSMVFGSGADGTETIMGQSCEQVTAQLAGAGADMIGCSCGMPIDDMVLVVRLIREQTDLPIVACPDAGQRELEGPEIVYRETPEDFASKVPSLVRVGANVIGGCCGVTYEHLKCAVGVLTRDRG